MAIAAVSVAPLGTGSTSLSSYVAGAEKILREDGRVSFRLGPMFTTIQGELGDCLDVIRKMSQVPSSGRGSKPFFKPLKPIVIDKVTITGVPRPPAPGGRP